MLRRSLADIVATGAVTAAYLVAGKLGLSLAFVNASATLVWPPTGIAVASLILLGYRFWPGILIGAFLVNVTTAGSIATSFGIASGNTLEALLAAFLVRRLANGRNAFDGPADVFKFVGLAAILSTTVSATVGVSNLLLGGLASWAESRTIWLTWWLGDAVGAIVVSPPILLWANETRWTWNWRRFLEGAALLLFLSSAASIVFTGWLLPNHGYPLEFVCIPPLIWAGFRFGRREVATLVLLLTTISIWGTLRGYGPFARESPNESLLLLQAFTGVIAIMTLALAAVVAERRKAQGTLSHLASIVESSNDAIIGKNLDGVILSWNSGAEKIYGYAAGEAIGKNISLLAPPSRLDEIPLVLEKLKRGERVEQYETTRVTKGGQVIDVSLTVSPTRNASGEIQGASVIARDLSERKRFEARLVHLADHDPLTDLIGRRRFRFELERQIALSQRYGAGGAVIFLDLDDFKRVNDTLGHRAGDQLLVRLSRLLKARLRNADLLARLGGDEFAIVAPRTNSDQARQLTRQLLSAVGRQVAVLDDGQSVGITASAGIALFPEHGSTVEMVLTHADRAMYRAKQAGGNRLIVQARRGDRRKGKRFDGAESVREALRGGLLVLYGAPILDLRDDRVSHYEISLRLKGANGRAVSPASFLATAEQSHLIGDVDRWVVGEAMGLIARLQQSGENVGLSVRLSSGAFTDVALLEELQETLVGSFVDPAKLVLEITESDIADLDRARSFVFALNRKGCRFALDDIDSGFRLLSALKGLPVDYVKIGGGFVRDLRKNLADQHLIKNIVELSHELSAQTIATFVGDGETLELLRKLRLDYAQGDFIGLPRAADSIQAGRPKRRARAPLEASKN